jgi:hypothetical protein
VQLFVFELIALASKGQFVHHSQSSRNKNLENDSTHALTSLEAVALINSPWYKHNKATRQLHKVVPMCSLDLNLGLFVDHCADTASTTKTQAKRCIHKSKHSTRIDPHHISARCATQKLLNKKYCQQTSAFRSVIQILASPACVALPEAVHQ